MRISDWSSDVCSSDLLGKELREDVRLVRRQQAKRARMVAGLVERDQIDRVVVIELVDFPAGVLNRKVPSEQIDEQALPVLEHGFERTAIAGVTAPVDKANHDHGSVRWATIKSRRQRSAHVQ